MKLSSLCSAVIAVSLFVARPARADLSGDDTVFEDPVVVDSWKQVAVALSLLGLAAGLTGRRRRR